MQKTLTSMCCEYRRDKKTRDLKNNATIISSQSTSTYQTDISSTQIPNQIQHYSNSSIDISHIISSTDIWQRHHEHGKTGIFFN